jgi:hypothetical protein
MNSFAPEPGQAPDIFLPQGRPEVSTGVQHQVANPDLGVNFQPAKASPLIGKLMSFVAPAVAKKVAEQEQTKFIEGMLKVASGMTAKEIAEQHPGWASVFGEGAGVQGARVYEGLQDAAALERKFQEALPELRTLSPHEHAKYLSRILAGSMADDPLRNTAMQTAFLKAAPQWLKISTAEHVKFNQEQAVLAKHKFIRTAVQNFEKWDQEARSPGTTQTAEDLERHTGLLISQITPQAGDDFENHGRLLTQVLEESMRAGNFGAVGALRRNGLFDALPPADRDRLEHMYRIEGQRVQSELLHKAIVKNPAAGSIVTAAAALRVDPPVNPKALADAVAKINKAARDVTGVDVDYIPPSELDNLLARGLNAEQQKAAAAAREAASRRDAVAAAQAEMAKVSRMDAFLFQPGFADGSASTEASLDEGGVRLMQSRAAALWTQLPPEGQALMLRRAQDHRLLVPAQQITNTLASKTWNPNIDRIAQVLEAAGPAKAHYINREQEVLLEDYRNFRAGNLTPDAAWERARQEGQIRAMRVDLPAEDAAAVAEWAKKFDQSPWLKDRVGKHGRAGLQFILAAAMKDAPGHTSELRLQNALVTLKRRGVEFFKDFGAVRRDPAIPENWRTKLNEGAGEKNETIDKALGQLLNEMLKLHPNIKTDMMGRAGVDIPMINMVPDPNKPGEFMFVFDYQVLPKDDFGGEFRRARITRSQLQARINHLNGLEAAYSTMKKSGALQQGVPDVTGGATFVAP